MLDVLEVMVNLCEDLRISNSALPTAAEDDAAGRWLRGR